MNFEYGDVQTGYLSKKDKALKGAIERIGHIDREMDEDLFSSMVHHIIGQQISVSAQKTVWNRMKQLAGEVTPQNIGRFTKEELQKCGITFKKADYILGFSRDVLDGKIDPKVLYEKSDEEIVKILSSVKGIGVWTAEMIMTFCMGRQDVVSYGDLAVLRGMRMLYRHRKITPELFKKYKKRYSPYGSVAALYLWAIAGGALPELTDPANRKEKNGIRNL